MVERASRTHAHRLRKVDCKDISKEANVGGSQVESQAGMAKDTITVMRKG